MRHHFVMQALTAFPQLEVLSLAYFPTTSGISQSFAELLQHAASRPWVPALKELEVRGETTVPILV